MTFYSPPHPILNGFPGNGCFIAFIFSMVSQTGLDCIAEKVEPHGLIENRYQIDS
jgi:hypothetical protein